MKYTHTFESFLNESTEVNESAARLRTSRATYTNRGKLEYDDRFLATYSLAKTIALDLGFDEKNEKGGGPWIGFDHVAMFGSGKKGDPFNSYIESDKYGTMDDALRGKYTYDELKAAAANHFGIKQK